MSSVGAWCLALSVALNLSLLAGIIEYARNRDVLGSVQYGGGAFLAVGTIAVAIVLSLRP
ncbi:hypothetical protein ACH4E8_22805 [Streptomyces sp. NPDC017979]|uniref:hypothetical protein n=1 Tax=Streptomyces sp. NPDC017979 TaxID=3365024 RepID=UPI0037A998E7